MRKNPLIIALFLSPLLSGCGAFKDTFGFNKNPPDEFQVITKAPLVIPPDFSLRPPRSGDSAQSQFSSARLALNVMGSDGTINEPASRGEQTLLTRTGANNVDVDIRSQIDNERNKTEDADPSLVERLTFGLFGS